MSLQQQLTSCFQTATNHDTHEIVRANLHRVPDFVGGDGHGVRPRYCPARGSAEP